MRYAALALALSLSACSVSIPGNDTRLDDLTDRIRDLEGYRDQLEPWRQGFVQNMNKSLESLQKDIRSLENQDSPKDDSG